MSEHLCQYYIYVLYYMVLPISSDMIGTIEAALIRLNQPLWNVVVDGFGNHDPGRGCYEQAKSDWDVIHPGRPWADRCNGVPLFDKLAPIQHAT
jgi:hypothetical protein